MAQLPNPAADAQTILTALFEQNLELNALSALTKEMLLSTLRANLIDASTAAYNDAAAIVQGWHVRKGGYTELAHVLRDRGRDVGKQRT